jgi:glycosyltransferase involved in cell wall biosynthesis
MTGAPRVSVVVPTRDRADLLPRTLESVLAQTFQDFEVLVVDDGSRDGTREAVAALGDRRISYHWRERTGYVSRLRNFGLERARGAYVALLDSDDLWREEKLAAQVRALDGESGAGWALCGSEWFDSATGEVLRRDVFADFAGIGDDREVFVCPVLEPLLLGTLTIFTPAVMVRTRLLEIAGRFDPALRCGEYEFFGRLALHSPAAIVRSALVRIRRHAGNSSLHTGVIDYEEAICSVERLHARGAIPDELHRERLARFRERLARLAGGSTG